MNCIQNEACRVSDTITLPDTITPGSELTLDQFRILARQLPPIDVWYVKRVAPMCAPQAKRYVQLRDEAIRCRTSPDAGCVYDPRVWAKAVAARKRLFTKMPDSAVVAKLWEAEAAEADLGRYHRADEPIPAWLQPFVAHT